MVANLFDNCLSLQQAQIFQEKILVLRNILGELDTTRPVPFRLTPNIIEYLSSVGINGPLTASMIATARCFVYPNFKVRFFFITFFKTKIIFERLFLFRYLQF